jgi:hypothetical protein
VKDRAKRNSARSLEAKQMGVKPTSIKGDVGHSRAVSKGGGNTLSNLFVQNASQNRSFARTASGAMKSELSSREKKAGKKVASQRKRK